MWKSDWKLSIEFGLASGGSSTGQCTLLLCGEQGSLLTISAKWELEMAWQLMPEPDRLYQTY